MEPSNKQKVVELYKSFETGDAAPARYLKPDYIQHNLSIGDGLAGFKALMGHRPPGGFKATIVRLFEDGDFVFLHSEYDFFGPKVGLDIFRFENGQIAEHWDNLTAVQPKNPSGRTQTDGETAVTDLAKTEANKATIRGFVAEVLVGHQMDKLPTYLLPTFAQHNPAMADGIAGLGAAFAQFAQQGLVLDVTKTHRILGEGNFVLVVSEGRFGKGEPAAFYDLFRLENGKIAEHWDVIEPTLPKDQWRNQNGKF